MRLKKFLRMCAIPIGMILLLGVSCYVAFRVIELLPPEEEPSPEPPEYHMSPFNILFLHVQIWELKS